MPRHTLLEPRVLAAVALFGLGGGIGIGLMLAHTFPLVGLLLSLASVAAVISLYYGHFHHLYRSLIDKRAYTGRNIKELLIIFPLLIVVTTLSFSLYFSPPSTDNPAVRSRLEFNTIQPVKYPNASNSVSNVQLKNVGTLTATRGITRTGGLLSNRVLSVDQERAEMNKLIFDMQQVSRINRQGQIQPGQAAIITIRDLNKSTDALLEADDNQLADIPAANCCYTCS
jgi:hypothetical protein